MLTFWKINSETIPEWNDEPNDLTFAVVLTEMETVHGVSTCFLSNRKDRRAVLSKHDVVGHSTLKIMSQFDVKTETGVSSLKEGMEVVNSNALRAFIDAKRARPFASAGWERVLQVSDAQVFSHMAST